MSKKTYNKPALKTREIKLGVFGDYSDGGRNGNGNGHGNGNGKGHGSGPIETIGDLGIRME